MRGLGTPRGGAEVGTGHSGGTVVIYQPALIYYLFTNACQVRVSAVTVLQNLVVRKGRIWVRLRAEHPRATRLASKLCAWVTCLLLLQVSLSTPPTFPLHHGSRPFLLCAALATTCSPVLSAAPLGRGISWPALSWPLHLPECGAHADHAVRQDRLALCAASH